MDLSPVADMVWQMACVETTAAKAQVIEPEHFLAALTKLRQLSSGAAAEAARAEGVDLAIMRPEMELVASVLDGAGIDPDAFRHDLRHRLGQGTYQHGKGATVHRSERAKRTFQRAEAIAREMAASETGTGHLLLAILEDKDSGGCRLLVEKGAVLESLAAQTRSRLAAMPQRAIAGHKEADGKEGEKAAGGTGTPFLDRFGRDLTKAAQEGKLGPVIGRRAVILQIIQTLARRSKNNPVLVGEAGVGKTAIAEAVAIRAADGKDSQVLGGKRIVEISMTTLVGGTKYRGEFEDRVSRLIDECRTHGEVILFIDELHTVIGAGLAEGSMDAANILKPALARGEVRCIGATTIAEYRRYVESDPALERRFERVLVPEPTREETLEILRGIRPKWEQHHWAKITNKALEAAVDLSIRFDCDHQLPDKAIDLVDKAGSRAQVPVLSMRLDGQKRGQGGAGELPGEPGGKVTELTIAQVLSQKIGVPLEVITGHLEGMSQSRLLEMEAFLKTRVIGQKEAVERVCQRLLMAHAGLAQRRGPLGVFLFLGPTGVGKTELARSIAQFLFGSERDVIRLDMSEYMEEHSVAKLIGSPPGYVGHEEEGQLTGRLRSRPYSVVLLDEIEKAHPRVFDMFLQVFDEGRLTDSKGRTADARSAIFVLTSNIAADKDRGFGFRHHDTSESKSPVLQEVKNRFRAEFINRIDEQIVFRPLGMEDVAAILKPILGAIAERFQAKYGKLLCCSHDAIEMIAAKGYSEEYGVRHLHRAVQELLEVPLTRLVLSGKITEWRGVLLGVSKAGLDLGPVPAEAM